MFFASSPYGKPAEGKTINKGKLVAFEKLKVPKLDDEIYHFEEEILPPNETDLCKSMPCRFACCRDEQLLPHDEEIVKCFLNHPPLQELPNPITILNIQNHQFEDDKLNQLQRHFPHWYPVRNIQNRPLVCYCVNEEDPEERWKIALPRRLVGPVIHWYHRVLGHCGSTRLHQTISSCFYFRGLKGYCETYRCASCDSAC